MCEEWWGWLRRDTGAGRGKLTGKERWKDQRRGEAEKKQWDSRRRGKVGTRGGGLD